MISSGTTTPAAPDAAALLAQLAAREQRIELLEGEVRWLKSQLFGRSSEKTALADIHPDQRWLREVSNPKSMDKSAAN